MYDLLKQIERQYGSVTEYNRSIEEDKAHKESALHDKKCGAKCSNDQKMAEQFDAEELPF